MAKPSTKASAKWSPGRPKSSPSRKKKMNSNNNANGNGTTASHKQTAESNRSRSATAATPVLENGVDLRRVYTLPSKSLDAADSGKNGSHNNGAHAAALLRPSKSDVVNAHRLDRFGFITNMDSHGKIHEADVFFGGENDGTTYNDVVIGSVNNHVDRIPTFQEAATTERRTKKWKTMMSSWNAFYRRRRKLVVKRLRKGVPDTQRGKVWALLGDLPAKIKEHPGLYRQLVQQSAGNELENGMEHSRSFKIIQETIERDIHRTYPRHAMFYDEQETGGQNGAGVTTTTATTTPSRMSARGSGSGSGHNLSTEVDLNGVDVDDDDDEVGLCGTTEISTMIRELEFSTKKGVSAATTAAAATGSTADAPSFTTTTTTTSAAPGAISISQRSGSEDVELSPQAVIDQQGGQPSLRRVLKAYSLYDREIGYCQGMNFIAGMFLTLMSEEESFWLLVAIMYDQPCEMRGLFGEGMRETHKVLYVAEKLIHQFLPKLAKHLEKENIHITMFATQWLLTQYTSSFKFDLVTRIWDCFLGEGWKITYRVMLAMLSQWQSSLLKMSFEDILAFFRELPDNVDGQKVMEIAVKIPLRKNHIVKLEKEWRAQHPN